MRLGHEGLVKYAATKDVKMSDLDTGEAIIFINRARTMMKSYSWNKVISFVRSKDIKRPIDIAVLDYLPKTFNVDGEMDYAKALKAMLEKKLQGKHKLDPELVISGTYLKRNIEKKKT